MKKYLFFVLISSLLIVPLFVSAGILDGPLVPCGRGSSQCTLCDIFRLAKNVIDFIIAAMLIIAPAFIVIGGIRILVAGAKPDEVESGKKIITNVVIGIVIALCAWLVLSTLFNILANPNQTQGIPWPWNVPSCTGGGPTQ